MPAELADFVRRIIEDEAPATTVESAGRAEIALARETRRRWRLPATPSMIEMSRTRRSVLPEHEFEALSELRHRICGDGHLLMEFGMQRLAERTFLPLTAKPGAWVPVADD